MPDSYLDEDLARARTDLLDAIEQPPLAEITGRASTLRRRRRAVRSATALVAIVAVGVAVLRPWAGHPEATVPPADTPPSGPVYTAAGITINGLTEGVPQIPDLPGAITDVEFADPDHGYVITNKLAFAATEDGGFTWQRRDLPAGTRTADLILFPGGELAVPDGYVSADGGRTWRAPSLREVPAAAGKDELLRLGPQNTVEVWSPQYGRRGVILAEQAPLSVTWVADRPTADGVWWVGGSLPDATGRPALASSRDGGHTWRLVELDAPPGLAQISVLGSHAYAMDIGADRRIRAILYSADGGLTFAPTRTGGDAQPATLAGEAVPLLDGRLLITTSTGHRWYLSGDNGATFTEATGSLPVVGGLRRTWAGYVAYDLFGPEPAGWAAFSSDGSTWRKLHIR
jgi:hypothetical protein